MVQVSDGLGRPLYILDHDGKKEIRLHPYTNQVVPDDFEYEYPTRDKYYEKYDRMLIVTPLVILALASVGIMIYELFIKK